MRTIRIYWNYNYMPELPEVETIKLQLSRIIKAKTIKKVEVRLPKMVRGASLEEFEKKVAGAKVKDIKRRAKLLIIELSNGYSLVIHLKLTGQLIYNQEPQKHSHLIYHFTDGSVLLHNDMRQFGYVKLVKTSQFSKLFQKEKFGPEPLEKSFTLEKFKELLSKKKRSRTKPLLMDQTFVAGVGNVYAQEACFFAKIKPTRTVGSLTDKEIKNLYDGLKKILRESIKHKGSSVDTYVDIKGKQGGYLSFLKVYRREGKKCLRCGAKIKSIRLGGRGTCFCPKCQK